MATALTGSSAARPVTWPSRRIGHDEPARAQRFFPGARLRQLHSSRGESAHVPDSHQNLSTSERERLLLAHLPQVRSIALRMCRHFPRHVAGEDVFQAGVVGLIEAANHFDPRKHAGFSAYAQFRVRGAMLDNLRACDWGPRSLRRSGRRLERKTARLRGELGRTPDEFETARAMGMGIGEYRRLTRDLHGLRFESLEQQSAQDSPTFAEPRAFGLDPFEQCLRTEIGAVVAAAAGEMDEQERRVLDLYYGEELTMKEVGQALGVGESRVCQLHAAALARLRARIAKKTTADRKNERICASGKTKQIRGRVQ